VSEYAIVPPIADLRSILPKGVSLRENVPMAPFTTMQVGGPAERLLVVRDVDLLAEVAAALHDAEVPHWILGSGSNLVVSDRGIPGVVVLNACDRIEIGEETLAECGCWFQDLFLAAVQAGLEGLEFAVGIPGTLGGALVSNAGAYRSSIGNLLTAVDLVWEGARKTVEPSALEFRYRDSILRRPGGPRIALLRAWLRLEPGEPHHIYNLARDYQRQRISKQPPHPSVGSFFKNVLDRNLAEALESLPPNLKEAGVIPAGYLLEACGMKGMRRGNAIVSRMHANFLCNLGGARASDIRWLAEVAKRRVRDQFGVELEEEVLYAGDWSHWEASH
jgi:UDP-N-acetylmuramate dehydrogenase